MRQVTLYTARELKEQFPDAYERLLGRKLADEFDDDMFSHYLNEMMDSIKGLFAKCSGVKLVDWSIGAYNRGNHIKVEFAEDAAANLSGPRAMAWIENNLLYALRNKWKPISKQPKAEWEYRKWYKPGHISDCPFTGMCYDCDILESLLKDIRDGETLKDAFRGIADAAEKTLEGEYDYLRSREYIEERLLDDDFHEYDEHGTEH